MSSRALSVRISVISPRALDAGRKLTINGLCLCSVIYHSSLQIKALRN